MTIWDECATDIGKSLSTFKNQVESLAIPVSCEDLKNLVILVSTSLETIQQHMKDCAVKRKPDKSNYEMLLLKSLMSASEELGPLELNLELLKDRLKRVRLERYSTLHSYFIRLTTAFFVIHITSTGPEDLLLRFAKCASIYSNEFANIRI